MANKLLITQKDWEEHLDNHPALKLAVQNFNEAVRNSRPRPAEVRDMSYWVNRDDAS